jgi:hypothetical protein
MVYDTAVACYIDHERHSTQKKEEERRARGESSLPKTGNKYNKITSINEGQSQHPSSQSDAPT